MAADTWTYQIDSALWKLYKACSCGGVLKHRYRNTGNSLIELHILPTRNIFRIFNGTKQTHQGAIAQLQQTLQNI